MRLLLIGALALSAAAGCAQPDARGCSPGFPLALSAYPRVGNASMLEVQTTLWNCTKTPIQVEDPCELRNGLMPTVRVENDSYFLPLFTNATATKADRVECDHVTPPRRAAAPGDFIEQRFGWNGRILDERGDAVLVTPGVYRISVRAGPMVEFEEVAVPWPGQT